MKNLIESEQEIKLSQMLQDQNVSIQNIEVVDEEIVKPGNKLFNPFFDEYGTPKRTDNFQTWVDFYLETPKDI